MHKEQIKIESAVDWAKAKNFIPKKNQIIIYDGDKNGETYSSMPRIKLGDGINTVENLPFVKQDYIMTYIEEEEILTINM